MKIMQSIDVDNLLATWILKGLFKIELLNLQKKIKKQRSKVKKETRNKS